MIHIYILCKYEHLTLPRTGDIGPESCCDFAISQDFWAGNLGHLVDTLHWTQMANVSND